MTTIDAVTDQPILSVVVPVHNVARYVSDMLASLRRNAQPDFEFIVVDDGSTDETPELVEMFGQDVPTLRVVRHDAAVGLADARNAGTAVARGRYLTFLDGDDWIAPGYLADLVAVIEALGCDFVRADHIQVRGRNREVHRAPEARRNQVLDPRTGIMPAHLRTMVDYPYAWAGIYRRDLGDLLHFPGHLHTAEDRPWIWRLHREARSYAVTSLAGVFYRRMVTTSLTQVGDARQLNFLDAFAMVFEPLHGEDDVRPKAIRQFLALLAHHIRMQDRFTPQVQREMHSRAAELLRTLPLTELETMMPTDDRAQLLRPLLPQSIRRRIPARRNVAS